MQRELIAILRGIDPLQSIEKMVNTFGSDATIGAGTVLHQDEVKTLANIGCQMVIWGGWIEIFPSIQTWP